MYNFHLGSSIEQEISKNETINRTEKLLFGLKFLVATVYLHNNTYFVMCQHATTHNKSVSEYIVSRFDSREL